MSQSRRIFVFCSCLVAAISTFMTTPLVQGQAPVQSDPTSLVPQYLLPLLHAPEVHKELKLTQMQRNELKQLLSEIDGDWFRARNLPKEKQFEVVRLLEDQVKQWLEKNASPEQRERITQLEYQAQSLRVLLRPEIAEAANLKPSQISQMTELAHNNLEKLKKKVFQK